MTWLAHLWHWIEIHTGTINEAGPYYGFWSGFGSDLGELAIVAGILGMYRKHNCHVRWCFRLQRHAVAGTDFVTCRKHHPTIGSAPSASDIAHVSDHR